MPYLETERKLGINFGSDLVTAGDLTYALTVIALNGPPLNTYQCAVDQLKNACLAYGRVAEHPDNFQTRCEVIGALRCAALEYRRRVPEDWAIAYQVLGEAEQWFYREVVAPYEDLKIKQNGDVF